MNFYKLSDPISGEKELLFTLNFDETGTCETFVNNTQTVYSFCDFGVYRGMLFLEPGKSIDLRLPPFREKSFANEKNPYFTPASFWFLSETKNHLNDKINAFGQKLNSLTDKHFNELYFKQSKTVYDSVLVQLNTAFPETKPATFVTHKKLETALINADIFRLRPEDYSEIFDDIRPEYWTHQAFITAFEKTFDRQLSYSAKAIKGKEVGLAVQKQDVQTLLNFTKTKYKVSGKMAELVLLKLLHDGFYSDEFSKTAIKNMVNSDLFQQNSNKTIKEAAKNISAKFTFLQKDTQAPKICLNDLRKQPKCTNSITTKFKYLVFADAETIVCQEHLKYLSRIDELFNKHLEIFVILRDTGNKNIDSFFAEHKVPGTTMVDTNNKYIDIYNIRSFPQCFLLNEKHKVTFTNAKAPLDGFEQQFGTYLRNELFMRQRNQAR
uniref:hypothetical protein n=1 Tax=uncultured Draconibacterium sp. TaxID=1573823 RepID=UPI00321757E7